MLTIKIQSPGASGISIEMADAEMEELAQRFSLATDSAANALQRNIGRYALEEGPVANFAGQHDPDGGAWKPLSTKAPPKGGYEAYKERHWPGEPILQRDHALIDSLSFRTEGDAVDIGSIGGPVYAGAHNYGSGHTPKREFAGMSSAAIQTLSEALEVFFEYGEWTLE